MQWAAETHKHCFYSAQIPNTPKSPAELCQTQNLFLIITFPVVPPPHPYFFLFQASPMSLFFSSSSGLIQQKRSVSHRPLTVYCLSEPCEQRQPWGKWSQTSCLLQDTGSDKYWGVITPPPSERVQQEPLRAKLWISQSSLVPIGDIRTERQKCPHPHSILPLLTAFVLATH